MYAYRTRFAKQIVAEFLVPTRKSNKVVIFCDGTPAVPIKKQLMEFFVKKGYWAIHPRYRGTWESDGRFLALSPEKDILDVVSGLHEPVVDIWSGKRFDPKPKRIIIVGVSFGGAAAILASRDPRVTKVIAVSPVVDWQDRIILRTDAQELKLMQEGFGPAYRFRMADWQKLTKGQFYNPVNYIGEYSAEKLLVIHAKDDDQVSFGPVKKFCKQISCQFISMSKGGHLSSLIITKPNIYNKKIKKFLNAKT